MFPIRNLPRPSISSCCSASGCNANDLKKYRCPVNGVKCSEVRVRTIVHHLKAPWDWIPSAEHYYFCNDPGCDVAYFGDDCSVVPKSKLRSHIGTKEPTVNDLLCHCFGVSRGDFERNPATRDFVKAQTKAGLCSCETSNPSGQCCLKGFPKRKGEELCGGDYSS